MAANKYRDQFESLYLLVKRLSESMTPEAEAFISTPDIKKGINYSVGLFAKKNYKKMGLLGVESEDLHPLASCYAMIFFTKYYKNLPNSKAAFYSMLRFIGQRLHKYLIDHAKKMQIAEMGECFRNPHSSGFAMSDFYRARIAIDRGDQEDPTKVLLGKKFSKRLDSKQRKKLIKLIEENKDPNVTDLAIELCQTHKINLTNSNKIKQ